ncbi:hypothetical protein CEE36_05160 [candidate division TA06 bacterium B3_TA06]|uniref:Uncharacterized protein n=1 Tax=candidate division TA06 bacterium B3_TA06 TaxID=2012487 RepID=A0A532V7H1_UNCT6|nr:MAG: hypothetical protein CEE36_05160 [candidate division TA06 bacterium B3_TA06]
MPYATIREILSEVDAENPPAPEHFPDFNPTDIEAWAYLIHVYLDSSQSDFGRPSFLPKYTRATGGFQYGFLSQENPFAPRYPANYDKAIKATYIKKILDYITILTRAWIGRDKISLIGQKQVMGFDLKGETIDDRWTFFLGLYNRAMQARDIAWRKIMTYCATLIGNQNASNTRIIIPEMVILYSYVKAQWDAVFGQVANLVISSGYRTPAEQRGLKVPHSAQTTHAVGGTIDVQPDLSAILFTGQQKRFVFWGYLAWLFRVVGNDRLEKVPYTLVETRKGNNVVHVSYAYLLYTQMKDEYKAILPGFLLPYDGDLPHIHDPKTGKAKVKAEMQGPNTIPASKYWNTFNEGSFNFSRLGSDAVNNLTGAGAVSASWMAGFVKFLQKKEDLTDLQKKKISRINLHHLDKVQSTWPLP